MFNYLNTDASLRYIQININFGIYFTIETHVWVVKKKREKKKT